MLAASVVGALIVCRLADFDARASDYAGRSPANYFALILDCAHRSPLLCRAVLL